MARTPGAWIVVQEGGREVVRRGDRLVVGTRIGCDLVLRDPKAAERHDPVAADRHCEVTFAGGFRIRDLGSVTGTWVDGVPAQPDAELVDGCEIVVGVTRLRARHEERDGLPALVLDLSRNGFRFALPRKGVFDSDPDLWAVAEVDLGRFPALRTANRVAAAAAVVVLVAGTLVTAAAELLADPGPLLDAHAQLFAAAPAAAAAAMPDFARRQQVAAEQGCAACHQKGHGTPDQKCMQCHRDLAEAATRRHPFLVDGELSPPGAMALGEAFCTRCHIDHTAPGFLQSEARQLTGDCARCHGREPDLPPPPPRRDRPDGVVVATFRFAHADHVEKGIACDVCHQVDPELPARMAARLDDPDAEDFAPVPFETCAACHVEGATPSSRIAADQRQEWAPEKLWQVLWHGSEDGARTCGQCHTERRRGEGVAYGPALRTVQRLALGAAEQAQWRGAYRVGRRTHQPERAHAGGADCARCHLDGPPAGGEAVATFWHALHLPAQALAPAAASEQEAVSAAQCLRCHGDRRASRALAPASAGGFRWAAEGGAQAACADCHRESPGDDALPLVAVRLAGEPAWPSAPVSDFPHAAHMGVAGGCFSCHELVLPAGAAPHQRVPRTRPQARDCRQCHWQHQNIAGGACAECHPSPPDQAAPWPRSWGRRKPNVYLLAAGECQPPRRPWPARNAFRHLSPGHEGEACETCHDRTALASSRSLAAVPIPRESDAACRDCHLRERFHWR